LNNKDQFNAANTTNRTIIAFLAALFMLSARIPPQIVAMEKAKSAQHQ
jgi:hypothetical protein